MNRKCIYRIKKAPPSPRKGRVRICVYIYELRQYALHCARAGSVFVHISMSCANTPFTAQEPGQAEFERKKMDKIYEAQKQSAISVDLMRRSDAYTIEHFIPGRELMYRAANGVYEAYDGWRGKKIAIVVGGGNNGGDGYALAGILKKNDIPSVVYSVSDKMSEDGRYYHDIAVSWGVEVREYKEDTGFEDFEVIVDCILGTGFSGEVRGKAKEAIYAINATEAYVISVDINSGLNGDTGEGEISVRSDLTVSIGYFKKGLFLGESPKRIGRLVNVDIGIVLIEEA